MLQKKQKVFAQADKAFGIEPQNGFKNTVFKTDMNVLRIIGLILRTNEATSCQKIKNNHSQLKIYWLF